MILGANDLLLCQHDTADSCASPAELGATLARYAANLGSALAQLRSVYTAGSWW
jgi:hypothetical protein